MTKHLEAERASAAECLAACSVDAFSPPQLRTKRCNRELSEYYLLVEVCWLVSSHLIERLALGAPGYTMFSLRLNFVER